MRNTILGIVLSLFCFNAMAQSSDHYISLSQQFLKNLKSGKEVNAILKSYASMDVDLMQKDLLTEQDKIAFWVNTYNAFVIHFLQEDSSSYDDRGNFFKSKQMNIAGIMFSFDDLEHGILRNSRWKYGLGYIKKWFIPEHIRKLSVEKVDYRIHFALNCGAKSCPPVPLLASHNLDKVLDESAFNFLKSVTTFEDGTINTTPIFNWFKGDFGGSKGIKKILLNYNVVPESEKCSLKYIDYDWTVDVDNYSF